MSLAMTVYDSFLYTIGNKEIDLNSDTLKVALLNGSYTPSMSHSYLSDLSLATTEISGTGYTSGGVTLTRVTYIVSDASAKLAGGNPLWQNLTASNITYAVLYNDTPADNKPLIAYIKFDPAKTVSASDFEIVWNASGILAINKN